MPRLIGRRPVPLVKRDAGGWFDVAGDGVAVAHRYPQALTSGLEFATSTHVPAARTRVARMVAAQILMPRESEAVPPGVLTRFLSCGLGLLIATMWWLGVSAGDVHAARVVVLDHDGRASVQNDVALDVPALTPRVRAEPANTGGPEARPAGDRTVRGELSRLFDRGLITRVAYRRYATSFNSALIAVKRLRGARAVELEAVVENLHNIAAAGLLTPSRLPALFLTLDRNRQWWRSGPLLSYGQRVEFAGSDIVWEYYPGQGIELQVLGSFGKAQWFCAAGAKYAAKCQRMVAELIPLAANRAGGLVWEYYFTFDGGVPPWTSAMSQGTALQALADAYKALGDPTYLDIGRRALRVFGVSPPLGVAVRTKLGMRFVQYSFASARGQDVLNGFLQSLIGLSDYAQASGDLAAARLFAAGDSEAQSEVPQFDTGAWSLYQPGEEDSLEYHVLVTGFLQQLCGITKARVYCATASNFKRYLKTPPVLEVLTGRLRARVPAALRFHVSKISRVGITLVRNGRTVFQTSADFTYGSHVFSLPVLGRAGRYTVRLDATDLAGNYSSTSRPLRVTR